MTTNEGFGHSDVSKRRCEIFNDDDDASPWFVAVLFDEYKTLPLCKTLTPTSPKAC